MPLQPIKRLPVHVRGAADYSQHVMAMRAEAHRRMGKAMDPNSTLRQSEMPKIRR